MSIKMSIKLLVKNAHKKAKRLYILMTSLIITTTANASVDIIDVGGKGLTIFSWVVFATTAFGFGWGIMAVLSSARMLPKLADQQADPNMSKKILYKAAGGLFAVVAVPILYGVIVYMFGTSNVIKALSFNDTTVDNYISLDL